MEALLTKHDEVAERVKRQKQAFFPLVLRDKKGRTTLVLTIEAESDPTVKVLFSCFSLLFSQEYALLFHNNSFQDEHLTELFRMDDVCMALQKFPALALNFISELCFVSFGDIRIQDGFKRVDLGPVGRLILGSERSVPLKFWKEKLAVKGDDGNNYVPEEVRVCEERSDELRKRVHIKLTYKPARSEAMMLNEQLLLYNADASSFAARRIANSPAVSNVMNTPSFTTRFNSRRVTPSPLSSSPLRTSPPPSPNSLLPSFRPPPSKISSMSSKTGSSRRWLSTSGTLTSSACSSAM